MSKRSVVRDTKKWSYYLVINHFIQFPPQVWGCAGVLTREAQRKQKEWEKNQALRLKDSDVCNHYSFRELSKYIDILTSYFILMHNASVGGGVPLQLELILRDCVDLISLV